MVIKLSWHVIEDRARLIAYDLTGDALMYPLMDYADFISLHQRYDPKTVRNEVGLLKPFFEYVSGAWEQLCDRHLVEYRDRELLKTKSMGASREDDMTARRTVNMKLRRAYHFIRWAQATGMLPEGTIGPFNCRVTADFEALESKARASVRTYHGRQMLPVLFRKGIAGLGPRPQYSATEEDRVNLVKYFARTGTGFTFARNVLLMEIADRRGWRRGSINSLLCSQFESDERRLRELEPLLISPPKQKFNYATYFNVDFDLVTQIRSFILTVRRPFLSEMGWTEARTEGRIFISARDGRPLTDQAISRIFGVAFREIGCPKGAGIHSFRRRFAERAVECELRERIRLGMDTSVASVAASVALEMGHANPDSLSSYVSRAQSKILGGGVDSGGL